MNFQLAAIHDVESDIVFENIDDDRCINVNEIVAKHINDDLINHVNIILLIL